MRIQFPAPPVTAMPLPPRAPRVEPDLPGSVVSGPSPAEGTRSFREMLADAGRGVNQLQMEADAAAERVSAGEVEDLHAAMIAMQKASLALELTVQVRNKAVEAYQEVMRMQV